VQFIGGSQCALVPLPKFKQMSPSDCLKWLYDKSGCLRSGLVVPD